MPTDYRSWYRPASSFHNCTRYVIQHCHNSLQSFSFLGIAIYSIFTRDKNYHALTIDIFNVV